MTTWITDDNGNRASVEYWGSEKAARASLATLINCENCRNCRGCTDCWNCWNCVNCVNCVNCTDCVNCENCRNCRGCTDCWNCWNCQNCRDCNLSFPHVRVPVSDGRGYTWLAILEDNGVRIRAGCRDFSPGEAVAHWTDANYKGPDTVRETAEAGIRWAADYLERTNA